MGDLFRASALSLVAVHLDLRTGDLLHLWMPHSSAFVSALSPSTALYDGSRIYHFVPGKVTRPFIPPRCALMNPTSKRFYLAITGDLHVRHRPSLTALSL